MVGSSWLLDLLLVVGWRSTTLSRATPTAFGRVTLDDF